MANLTRQSFGRLQILWPLLMVAVFWPGPHLALAGELTGVSDEADLQFRLPDLNGQVRDLGEFNDKVLLVNFWASWCAPCIEEMPSIQRLAEAMHGKPFAVIGINEGEAKRRVQAMVERLGIEFPVLLDRDGIVFKAWGANVLPTTYVLDRNGRVRYLGRGPLEWDQDEMIDLLLRLTEQPAPVE